MNAVSKSNKATSAQDEISLDDLFGQIDDLSDLDLASKSDVPQAVEVDKNIALTGDQVVTNEAVTTQDDDLAALFDGEDLDESALSLTPSDPLGEDEVIQPKESKKTEKSSKTKANAVTQDKKEPSVPRTTYVNAKKSEVLLDRLGGNTDEIVLEFADAELDKESLAEKQMEFLKLLNTQPHMSTTGESTQKKVAEKVVILFTFFKKGGKWNEVMYRTFKLLFTQGRITTGNNGNLVQELLKKPYSIGTARAQAGQMYKLLPLLKIAKETSKGIFEINEDSTIVARLRSQYFTDLPNSDEK